MRFRTYLQGSPRSQRLALCGGIAATIAGILLLGDDAVNGVGYLSRLATMMFVAGVMVLGLVAVGEMFTRVTRPAEDAYDAGRQVGFDLGFEEGRATVRPVVVPMASRSTCLECDDRHRREAFDQEAQINNTEDPDGLHKAVAER